MAAEYPIRLEVDDAAGQNRLTVFFRIILLIPHAIILTILGIIAAIIYVIAWFAILFTGSYPAGMWRFTAGVLRWGIRAEGYLLLLTDKYPPFAMGKDSAYPIRPSLDERVEDRNRLTTFWPIRYILAIPHLIIVGVLQWAVYVVVLIAWIAALITGSVPGGLHSFMAGWLRWYARANGYMLLLCDEYPPFSLN